MLVSLDEKVPEDLGVVIPDYFFWFYPPVFTVLKIVVVKKKFSLTLPWVVLFSDSGLYQSLGV